MTANDDCQTWFNASTINLNTFLCIEGVNANPSPSIVKLRFLSEEDHKIITKTESSPLSVNVIPLDRRGQIKLAVSMGCEHTIIVRSDLAVDSLLSADFLIR